jgi:transcriptional regulator with XRE-family HTH domain
LTERTLAQGAGIAQSGLSNVVSEKAREPDARTLRAIATFLNIDVFLLFRLLGYVPPSTEAYGAYSPLALYVAHRFEALLPERQQVLLHVLESLLEDVALQHEVKSVRENPDPVAALVGIDIALPEFINQAANAYLTEGRVVTAADIDPKDDELVMPGTDITLRFGQLDTAARARLVALMRHKIRQVYSPDLVNTEHR